MSSIDDDRSADDTRHSDYSLPDISSPDLNLFATIAPRSKAETALSFLLLLSCIGMWGINSVAFKVATIPPTGFDPLFLNGLRFLIVATTLLLVIGLTHPETLKVERADFRYYAIFGFVSIVFGETLQTFALRFTSVANLTLLSHGTLSLFTALWALALYKQPISRAGWIGATIALAGVALIATHSASGLRVGGTAYIGDLMAVGRSVFHSAYLLTLSRFLNRRSPLQVTTMNCVSGALWMLPYVVWRSLHFDWIGVPNNAWYSLLWSAFPATVYAFLAWNWAMRNVGAVAANNLFYLMPVASAFAAWILLGENISGWQIGGGAVIVVGIVLLRLDTLSQIGFRLPEPPHTALFRVFRRGRD